MEAMRCREEKKFVKGAGRDWACSETFSLQPSVCSYPPNPSFIGCLCPAMPVGLSREAKEVGVEGLNTCPSLW